MTSFSTRNESQCLAYPAKIILSKKNRVKVTKTYESGCYPVEKVIGFYSGKEKSKYYRVQWMPSWIPAENLVGCDHLIQKFFIEQNIINKDANNYNLLFDKIKVKLEEEDYNCWASEKEKEKQVRKEESLPVVRSRKFSDGGSELEPLIKKKLVALKAKLYDDVDSEEEPLIKKKLVALKSNAEDKKSVILKNNPNEEKSVTLRNDAGKKSVTPKTNDVEKKSGTVKTIAEEKKSVTLKNNPNEEKSFALLNDAGKKSVTPKTNDVEKKSGTIKTIAEEKKLLSLKTNADEKKTVTLKTNAEKKSACLKIYAEKKSACLKIYAEKKSACQKNYAEKKSLTVTDGLEKKLVAPKTNTDKKSVTLKANADGNKSVSLKPNVVENKSVFLKPNVVENKSVTPKTKAEIKPVAFKTDTGIKLITLNAEQKLAARKTNTENKSVSLKRNTDEEKSLTLKTNARDKKSVPVKLNTIERKSAALESIAKDHVQQELQVKANAEERKLISLKTNEGHGHVSVSIDEKLSLLRVDVTRKSVTVAEKLLEEGDGGVCIHAMEDIRCTTPRKAATLARMATNPCSKSTQVSSCGRTMTLRTREKPNQKKEGEETEKKNQNEEGIPNGSTSTCKTSRTLRQREIPKKRNEDGSEDKEDTLKTNLHLRSIDGHTKKKDEYQKKEKKEEKDKVIRNVIASPSKRSMIVRPIDSHQKRKEEYEEKGKKEEKDKFIRNVIALPCKRSMTVRPIDSHKKRKEEYEDKGKNEGKDKVILNVIASPCKNTTTVRQIDSHKEIKEEYEEKGKKEEKIKVIRNVIASPCKNSTTLRPIDSHKKKKEEDEEKEKKEEQDEVIRNVIALPCKSSMTIRPIDGREKRKEEDEEKEKKEEKDEVIRNVIALPCKTSMTLRPRDIPKMEKEEDVPCKASPSCESNVLLNSQKIPIKRKCGEDIPHGYVMNRKYHTRKFFSDMHKLGRKGVKKCYENGDNRVCRGTQLAKKLMNRKISGIGAKGSPYAYSSDKDKTKYCSQNGCGDIKQNMEPLQATGNFNSIPLEELINIKKEDVYCVNSTVAESAEKDDAVTNVSDSCSHISYNQPLTHSQSNSQAMERSSKSGCSNNKQNAESLEATTNCISALHSEERIAIKKGDLHCVNIVTEFQERDLIADAPVSNGASHFSYHHPLTYSQCNSQNKDNFTDPKDIVALRTEPPVRTEYVKKEPDNFITWAPGNYIKEEKCNLYTVIKEENYSDDDCSEFRKEDCSGDESDLNDVDEEFECDVCDLCFKTSVLLHRHRFIHCESRPFTFDRRRRSSRLCKENKENCQDKKMMKLRKVSAGCTLQHTRRLRRRKIVKGMR